MCNCINKGFKWIDKSVEDKFGKDYPLITFLFNAKMEEKHDKTEKKSSNWSDLEGIREKKKILDEKYAEIDMKLGSKTLKMKKKYGKTL